MGTEWLWLLPLGITFTGGLLYAWFDPFLLAPSRASLCYCLLLPINIVLVVFWAIVGWMIAVFQSIVRVRVVVVI